VCGLCEVSFDRDENVESWLSQVDCTWQRGSEEDDESRVRSLSLFPSTAAQQSRQPNHPRIDHGTSLIAEPEASCWLSYITHRAVAVAPFLGEAAQTLIS
jgi:hypothetical protein